MLREQTIPLPRSVIERALDRGEEKGFAALIESAFLRILNGTSGDRISMMQAAFTYLGAAYFASLGTTRLGLTRSTASKICLVVSPSSRSDE